MAYLASVYQYLFLSLFLVYFLLLCSTPKSTFFWFPTLSLFKDFRIFLFLPSHLLPLCYLPRPPSSLVSPFPLFIRSFENFHFQPFLPSISFEYHIISSLLSFLLAFHIFLFLPPSSPSLISLYPLLPFSLASFSHPLFFHFFPAFLYKRHKVQTISKRILGVLRHVKTADTVAIFLCFVPGFFRYFFILLFVLSFFPPLFLCRYREGKKRLHLTLQSRDLTMLFFGIMTPGKERLMVDRQIDQ